MKGVVIAVALLFASCVLKSGQACMCMPSHPQEDMCRPESFVALVKIRSEAYVKLQEPNEENEIISAGLINTVEQLDQSNEIDEDDASSIIPTASTREVILDDVSKRRRKSEADFLRYRIKIYKAYKGLNLDVNDDQKFYLYTSPDEGMCGRKFTVKGSYMIIGTIVDGRIRVGLCNHVIPWKSLPKAEKRNIRANMATISSTCSSGCQVTSCLWSQCSAKTRDECTWSYDMERRYGMRYHRANFLCVPGSKGVCQWSGEAMSKRSRKRRHSRRRHEEEAPNSHMNDFLP